MTQSALVLSPSSVIVWGLCVRPQQKLIHREGSGSHVMCTGSSEYIDILYVFNKKHTRSDEYTHQSVWMKADKPFVFVVFVLDVLLT